MIEVRDLTKKFGRFTALDGISCTIADNCIYGLVGSNGAGKSTLLRILAGVYKADAGTVTIDGQRIWENPEAKSRIAYVSDELFYLPGANMKAMADMYGSLYARFDKEKFRKLADELGLDTAKSLNTFSKGMRRQSLTILALATDPDYIYFDETFDGLDPVVRNFIKRLIVEEMNSRGATAIITSHSLRELEDTCDQLALLHKGGLVLESDIGKVKTSRFKVQVGFTHDFSEADFAGLDITLFRKSGSVANMIISGDKDETVAQLEAMSPVILDVLPLSLEEVFTYEMQALGYTFDISKEELPFAYGTPEQPHTERQETREFTVTREYIGTPENTQAPAESDERGGEQ